MHLETKEFLHFSPLRSVGNSRDQAGLPQDMWTQAGLGNLGSIAATMTTVNVVYRPNLTKHAGLHQKCAWMFIPLYCWLHLPHYSYHYDLGSLQQSSWLMITDSFMTSHTYIYIYTCMYVNYAYIYWRLSQSMN